MISLDEEIKKDQQTKHDPRSNRYYNNKYDGYRHRNKDYTYRKHYQNKQYTKTNTHNFIKITSLHWAVNKEQLQNLCEQYGKVKMCRIDWDKMGRSNETALVQFFYRQDAQKAQKQLNNYQLQGQKIQVQLSNIINSMPNKRHEIHKNYNNRYHRSYNRH